MLIDLFTVLHWLFFLKCKCFIVERKSLPSIFDKTVTNSGTGQAIANFTGETRLFCKLKAKEKLDRHVDTEAQEHEWIIMRRNEKRTNENFPSETSRLPESGLQRRMPCRRLRKSRSLAYRAIESARKYINKFSDKRKPAKDIYFCVFN